VWHSGSRVSGERFHVYRRDSTAGGGLFRPSTQRSQPGLTASTGSNQPGPTVPTRRHHAVRPVTTACWRDGPRERGRRTQGEEDAVRPTPTHRPPPPPRRRGLLRVLRHHRHQRRRRLRRGGDAAGPAQAASAAAARTVSSTPSPQATGPPGRRRPLPPPHGGPTPSAPGAPLPQCRRRLDGASGPTAAGCRPQRRAPSGRRRARAPSARRWPVPALHPTRANRPNATP
jgi:hypothetical protein